MRVQGVRFALIVTLACAALCSCRFDQTPSLGRYDPARDPDVAAAAGASAQGTTTAVSPEPADEPEPSNPLREPSMPSDASVPLTPAARAADGASVNDVSTADCPQGDYTATLTCTVEGAGVVVDAAGHFSLRRAGREQVLDIVSSELALEAPGFSAVAELSGNLDCQTGDFVAALTNSRFIWIVVPVVSPLTGSMSGQLANEQLSGTWSFTAPADTICSGTWTADQAQP